MNEFNDDISLLGDWMPPSPSPRFFFSSTTGDDGTSSVQGSGGGNKCVATDGSTSVNAHQFDQSRASLAMDATMNSYGAVEPKTGSRGGLVERMALRAGFNAPRLNTESIKPANLCKNPEVRSPYLTIPPGLSPTALLESPVFLTNSLVQPSPTTGKFSFPLSGNNNQKLPMSMTDDQNKNPEDGDSFAFKPFQESRSLPDRDAASKANVEQNKGKEKIHGDFTSFSFRPPVSVSSSPLQFNTPGSNVMALSSGFTAPSFPGNGGFFPSDNSHLHQKVQPQNHHLQSNSKLFDEAKFSEHRVENNQFGGTSSEQNHRSLVIQDDSSPFDEPNEDEGDQRSDGPNIGGGPSEDGYNWRKYGQKQVKGSEHPRGYYKCTHQDCQVKKKIERSPEGRVTKIIYRGAHNHPKPPLNRRSSGSSSGLGDAQLESEQLGAGDYNVGGGLSENLGVSSSSLPLVQDGNNNGVVAGNQFRTENGFVGSTSFSNDEDDEDRATHGSVSLGEDVEGDESESKRRRVENYTAAEITGAMRAIREPRVVVQTTSDVDILDDGYRWRKYGQKVVKGNPNPRSYYKCTSSGCNVRKHVERASHDLKSVITTYEGKHNHDVPAARHSSTHGHNSTGGGALQTQQSPDVPSHQVHRPEPSQVQMSSARFERPPFGSFGGGLPNFPPMGGPGPRYGFGMNQAPGLAGHGLGGLRQQNQLGNHPMLAANHGNPFFGHQPGPVSGNVGGMMMPKPEPVIENGGPNASTGGGGASASSSLYQQFMNGRLQLGPQM